MLSALDVLRMVERFDPGQLRGPDGRWVDQSAILRKVFKFGGNDVAVTVHADRSRTLDFGGARSVRLEERELGGSTGRPRRQGLRTLAFDAVDWSPGEGDALTRMTDDGRPSQDLLLGVKKVSNAPEVDDEETWDKDILSLHLPPNDDPSYDELMDSPPVATMRQRDLVALAELDIPANRVETGSGSLDVYRDGGKFVLRPAGRGPLVLDRKGIKSFYGAINDLWDEEYRDPRPDTEVVEKVVQTKAGDITVRMTGEGRRTQILGAGLSLDVDGEHLLDVMSALGDLVDSSSARESTALRAVDLLRIAEAVDFDPKKHPRYPDGRFRPLLARVVDAIRGGESGVLEKLSRPQLVTVAKAHGVHIRPRMSDVALRNETYAKIRADDSPPPKAPDVPAKVTKAATGDAALNAAPVSLLSNLERPRGVEAPRAAERAAFDTYGSDGQAINARLRRGGRITAPIAQMDAAMARSPLTTDVEAWRGVPSGSDLPGLDLSGDVTGAEFTDRAFVSTSVNPKVAERFAQLPGDGPKVVLRLAVPKGTHAVAFSGAGGISESQGELLFERGLTFRVTSDHGVDSLGLRRLDVDVQPPTKAAKKATPAKATPNISTARVATVAGAFHEDWRKTRRRDDGTFEPRVKKTKDAAWINAHGTDEVDIANTSYGDLPEDWQAENKAAAKVVVDILARRGGSVDLGDEATRQQVGEEIHQAWLSRNDWARGGDLDVPFADLPADEQAKDLDQLAVAMQVLAPKKIAAAPKSVDLDHLRTLDPEAARDELDLLKVDQLKPLLREQGLPVSGKKRELVDRLVASLGGGGPSTTVPLPGPGKAAGRDISGEVDYASLPTEYNRDTHHDDALQEIVRRQGFDGKPRVVSRADFDAAVKRGEVRETWRGIGRHKTDQTPDQLAEAYRTGDFYVGLGINGNGTYVAMRQIDAQYYAPTLLRIGLRNDARVISADDLDAEMDAYFAAQHRTAKHQDLQRQMLAELAKAKSARARANIRRAYFRAEFYGPDRRSPLLAIQRDPGRFAALRGYDAIEIPKERSPDKHAEMIILNRAATIVQAAE